MTPTRNPKKVSSTDTRRSSRALAQQLALARLSLPPNSRVCPACHHVFLPTFTTDRRCPECVAAAAEREAVRL